MLLSKRKAIGLYNLHFYIKYVNINKRERSDFMATKENLIMYFSDSQNSIFVGPVYKGNNKIRNILFRYMDGRAYDMANHGVILPIDFNNEMGDSYVRINACLNMDGIYEEIISRGEKVTVKKIINMFNERITLIGNLYLKENPIDFIENLDVYYTDRSLGNFLDADSKGHKKSIGAIN